MKATVVPRDPGRGTSSIALLPAATTAFMASAQFFTRALLGRTWACPAGLRGLLNGEGASATTAPKCT